MVSRWSLSALIFAGSLALATLAYAEGAWVLWEGILTERSGPHEQSWAVVAAWPTYEACQPMMSRTATDRGQRWRSVPSPPGGGTGNAPEVKVTGNQVAVLIKSGGFLNYTYLCLPDTIDPRAPKER